MATNYTPTQTVEYALMIDYGGGSEPEFIPATGPYHASRMAKTIYQTHSTLVVQRVVNPWCYVGTDATVTF